MENKNNKHQKEHAVWNRRSFLHALGLAGTASLVAGKLPIYASAPTPLSNAINLSDSDRVLVIIRLKGGNDGLNTVIPQYDYANYAALRPTLKINSANSFALSTDFRMPNYMNALLPLWNTGKMKVVHGVGYPNQNLSHFSSADLWSSAADNGSPLQTGVLGRYYEGIYPDYLLNPPTVPPAIQIGSLSNLLFNGEETGYAFSVANTDQLAQIAQNGTAYDMQNLPSCDYGEQLGFMRSVTNSTYNYASVINAAYTTGSNEVTYPDNDISNQFKIVARLIKGFLGTKVYMVTLDGFDTHANQPQRHQQLMTDLTEAVANFYQDLTAGGVAQDVLAMTISEFGRRAQENASSGTDHGAASTMLLFGEGLNGNGFVGTHPDLNNLDENGNLQFTTDYRTVYASVLEDWLCIDSNVVNQTLLVDYNRAALGLVCNSASVEDELIASNFTHKPMYKEQSVFVGYTLKNAATIKIELFDVLGKNLGVIFHQRQLSGTYEVDLNALHKNYIGQYYYRILVNDKAYSKAVVFTRK